MPKLRAEPMVNVSADDESDDSDDGEQAATTTINFAKSSSSLADTTMEINSDQPTVTISEAEPQAEMIANGKRAVEGNRPAPRLISLSSSSARTDDVGVKRTRSLGTTSNEQGQPAPKKPTQVDNESGAPYVTVNVMS
jgi:hypothetical protein